MDRDQFLGAAKSFDPSDREAFRRMVLAGRRLLGQSLHQVATVFRTAPGTVSRWEAGVCAPPAPARALIVRYFVEQAVNSLVRIS